MDSFETRGRLTVDDTDHVVHRLAGLDGAERLPYNVNVLLENLLRNEDGRLVTAEQVNALLGWQPQIDSDRDVALGLSGEGTFDISGIEAMNEGGTPHRARAGRRRGLRRPGADGHARRGGVLPPRRDHAIRAAFAALTGRRVCRKEPSR